MTQYSDNLNEDFSAVKTPARMDEDTLIWMIDGVMYFKSSTGNTTAVSEANPIPTRLISGSSIAFGKVTAGITEVELIAGASALAGRTKITIRCVGGDAIYIGKTGVTVSTGYPLVPGTEKEFYVGETVSLFAIAESDQTVHIIEEGE